MALAQQAQAVIAGQDSDALQALALLGGSPHGARAFGLDMPATRHFDLSSKLAGFGSARFDIDCGMRVPSTWSLRLARWRRTIPFVRPRCAPSGRRSRAIGLGCARWSHSLSACATSRIPFPAAPANTSAANSPSRCPHLRGLWRVSAFDGAASPPRTHRAPPAHRPRTP